MAAVEQTKSVSATSRHYPHAPITEALVDIRVGFDSPPTLEQLQQVLAAAGPAYARREDVFQLRGSFTLGAAVASAAEQQQTGFRASNDDQKRVFKAELTGLTASKLAPYSTWEDLQEEARRLWQIYSE